MRHRKHTFKIGSGSSHRRATVANLLKSLVTHGRVRTSLTKAKELRRHADRLVTLAKKNTLAARRRANALMMVSFNQLTSKEARRVKTGDLGPQNEDRRVVQKLFDNLGPRFENRAGGYTRIYRLGERRGDASMSCFIEYLKT